MKLFADDSKVISHPENTLSSRSMQNGIDTITECTKTLIMGLNAAKCKVILREKNRKKANYTIDDLNRNKRRPLEKSECERDLEVFISSDLK